MATVRGGVLAVLATSLIAARGSDIVLDGDVAATRAFSALAGFRSLSTIQPEKLTERTYVGSHTRVQNELQPKRSPLLLAGSSMQLRGGGQRGKPGAAAPSGVNGVAQSSSTGSNVLDQEKLEGYWNKTCADTLAQLGDTPEKIVAMRESMLVELAERFHDEGIDWEAFRQRSKERWTTFFSAYMMLVHPDVSILAFNSTHQSEFTQAMYPFFPRDNELKEAFVDYIGTAGSVTEPDVKTLEMFSAIFAASLQRDTVLLSAADHNATQRPSGTTLSEEEVSLQRGMVARLRVPRDLQSAFDVARNGTCIELRPGCFCREIDREPWTVPSAHALKILGGAAGPGECAPRVWGTWMLVPTSNGRVEGLELSVDTPDADERGTNASLAGALLDIAGDWTFARCAVQPRHLPCRLCHCHYAQNCVCPPICDVSRPHFAQCGLDLLSPQARASVMAAVSVWPGGKAVVEQCSIGGIGELAGTDFAVRRAKALHEEAVLERRLLEGLAASAEFDSWFERARDDPAMIARCMDPEVEPATLLRDQEALLDRASAAITDVQCAYEAKGLHLDPGDPEEAVVAATERGEREHDSVWADRVSRCRNCIEVLPTASVMVANSTLSLADPVEGAGLSVWSQGHAVAAHCTLSHLAFAVGLSGDAATVLEKCFVSDMESAVFRAELDTERAALSVADSTLGLEPCSKPVIRFVFFRASGIPSGGSLWVGPTRPGELHMVGNKEVQASDTLALPTDLEDDWDAWKEKMRAAEDENKRRLEEKLQEIDVSVQIQPPSAAPGRQILFASDEHAAPG